ncbi:MAG: hypothetical protein KF780_06690 [Sphingomonas sp.]|nr:hypothetical protein [Sphingomonas sp.]
MTPSLALFVALQAAAPESAPPALAPELQPLAFLVGSCWRATFPGTAIVNTHCYSAMHGGRHVRNRHIVEGAPGPYSGETIFRWDPERAQIRYDYWGSDGGYSTGTVVATDDGLSFPEESYLGVRGQRLTMRAAMRDVGPEGYEGSSEMREGEGWREMWRMRFTRIGPAPAGD